MKYLGKLCRVLLSGAFRFNWDNFNLLFNDWRIESEIELLDPFNITLSKGSTKNLD